LWLYGNTEVRADMRRSIPLWLALLAAVADSVWLIALAKSSTSFLPYLFFLVAAPVNVLGLRIASKHPK